MKCYGKNFEEMNATIGFYLLAFGDEGSPSMCLSLRNTNVGSCSE